MVRHVRSRCSFLTLVFLLCVLLALSCTDSCYKDEDNFADAGDGSGSSSNDNGSSTADACKVGEVFFQIDMIHPDKPCLVCTILDDKGYEYRTLTVNEGHSWGNWRALLDDVLLAFWPAE